MTPLKPDFSLEFEKPGPITSLLQSQTTSTLHTSKREIVKLSLIPIQVYTPIQKWCGTPSDS